jgi:hypothetical protein
MKRVSSSIPLFITLMLVGSGLSMSHGGQRGVAREDKSEKQRTEGKSRLSGAWRLVNSKDPRTGQMRRIPPNIEMVKLVVGGRYGWTVSQNGKAVSGAGGLYEVNDKTYTETINYSVGDNMLALVGSSSDFTWKIEDGKWHHVGTLKVGAVRQEIDQIWERIP